MTEEAPKTFYDFDGDILTIPLLRPFDHDGIKHHSVVLRELTVDESLDLDKTSAGRTSFEQDVHYFARMAGKPTSFICALKERDWKRIKNAYWETLGNVELELPSSE